MTDGPGVLHSFLYDHIPLARAMSISVLDASAAGVTLSGPLKENGNHHGTLFGGSASALAILAAWGWIHLRLDAEGVDPDLVIHRSTTDFLAPGRGEEVVATCPGSSEAAWRRFMTTYHRFGRARLQLPVTVRSDGVTVAKMRGWFVVLDPKAGD